MTTEDHLIAFLDRVRDRVDTDRGNALAIALSQVSELLVYLWISAEDYELANEQVMVYIELRRKGFTEGTHQLTPDEIQDMARHREATQTLHLRFDTFYVFAKILLDQIGPLLEAHFGQGRAVSLERHSKLLRNVDEYAQQRGLTPVPPKLTERMNDLSERAIEYRDRWITHDASPRTVKGTLYDTRSREARPAPGRLNPREGETGPQPLSPRVLLPEIEAYVVSVVDYIEENVSAIR
jgi:hypothetical protein